MSPSSIRVAAVQMCSGQNIDANLSQAKLLIEEAVSRNAQLVALPENFSYLDREGKKIDAVENLNDGPAVELLQKLAQSHSIYILGGTVPLSANDRVTNTCLVFGPDGQIITRYDKIHLFDIHLDDSHSFMESRYIKPGKTPVTFEALGAKMGLSVCYDLRFPELYRVLTAQGARVLFVPSAFTWRTGAYHWLALLRARAIENLSYVVAPAQFGRHNTERESFGHSVIIDPWGQILAQAPDRACVISSDLNFAYQDQLRKRLPCLNHRRIV
ncbi:MAG: carbon-nitrogen hydrolase family protein [Bacteroidetes bacterium]|nr:carbon-nitrogen hydrolase family protein [Bacteroidota bacterium]